MGEGAGGVHQRSDLEHGGDLGGVRPADQALLEHLGGEAGTAEVRDDQGSHAGHLRAGHGGALHQAVAVAGHRAEDGRAQFDIAARGADIHPLPVVGIIGAGELGADGTDRDHLVIGGRPGHLVILIACGEEDEAALHRAVRPLVALLVTAGILHEIVDGRAHGADRTFFGFFLSLIHIAPAVVGDDGTVVGGPDHGIVGISLDGLLRVGRILAEDGAGEDAHAALAVVAAGNAADANPVVADRTDHAGHVRTMVAGRDGVAHVTVDKALAAVSAARDAGCGQVGMVQLHAFVDHGHDHVGSAGRVVRPHRLDIEVTAGGIGGSQAAVIVQGPLLRGHRIIEIGGLADPAFRLCKHDPGQGQHTVGRLGGRLCGRVILDAVPAVEPGGAVARLPFAAVGEDPLHGGDAEALEHRGHGARLGGGAGSDRCGRLLVKLDNQGAGNQGGRLFLHGRDGPFLPDRLQALRTGSRQQDGGDDQE